MEVPANNPEKSERAKNDAVNDQPLDELTSLTVDDILNTESVIPRLNHPEIVFSHANQESLHRLLAEELYLLMSRYSAMCIDTDNTIDGLQLAVPTAPLVHVASKDGVIDSSLRLQAVLVKPLEQSELSFSSALSARNYLVFQLDTGKLFPASKEKQALDEDDFSWQPYVYAVINQADPNDCSIYSPEKGLPELGGMDLVMASEVVEYMRTELLAKDFKRDAPHDQIEKVTTVFDGHLPILEGEELPENVRRTVDIASLEPFDVDDQLRDLRCLDCTERDETMCGHGDSVTVLN